MKQKTINTMSAEQLTAIAQAVALALASQQQQAETTTKTRAKKTAEKPLEDKTILEVLEEKKGVENFPLITPQKTSTTEKVLAIIQHRKELAGKEKLDESNDKIFDLIFSDLLKAYHNYKSFKAQDDSENSKYWLNQISLYILTFKTFVKDETAQALQKKYKLYFSHYITSENFKDLITYRSALIKLSSEVKQ